MPPHSSNLDALADVLKAVRLSANTYFCSDFAAPWGIDVPHGPEGLFHVVVEGRCLLQLNNSDTPMQLNTGDIVAFPTGGGHWISDHAKSPKTNAQDVVGDIIEGNNPFQPKPDTDTETNAITLLCGAFQYDSSIDHPFLKDLPCFIHIKAAQTPELAWLRTMISVLSNESRSPSPGSTAMVDKLTEILFIQLIRFHMYQSKTHLGYMAALADAQIGRALNLIHGETHAQWSIERLADAVALSRTTFTEKFTTMVCIPPKSYLVNWRMQKAKTRLASGTGNMYDIAECAGYSSEAAFSKAFKKLFEITPGQFKSKR